MWGLQKKKNVKDVTATSAFYQAEENFIEELVFIKNIFIIKNENLPIKKGKIYIYI